MFVLKLPPFFTGLNGERKRAAISKLTFIWTLSSRSYIVFALEILPFVKSNFFLNYKKTFFNTNCSLIKNFLYHVFTHVYYFLKQFSYHRLASRSWTELLQSCFCEFVFQDILYTFNPIIRKLNNQNLFRNCVKFCCQFPQHLNQHNAASGFPDVAFMPKIWFPQLSQLFLGFYREHALRTRS